MTSAAVTAHDGYLLACVAGAVLLLLLLVVRLRLHAAIGLCVAAMALGISSGIPLEKVPVAFSTGVGDMMGHIAIILGMGALLGQLLASSGAAAALGRSLVDRCGNAGVPWALLMLGILVGIPVFFEVGLVLLLPIVMDASRRSGRPPILEALPVLAGLSITHGLLPPHPAALLAATEYHAGLARVIVWGLVVGVPTAILAGPVLQAILVRVWKRRAGTDSFLSMAATQGSVLGANTTPVTLASDTKTAGALQALAVILFPVVFILAGGWADAMTVSGELPNHLLHMMGSPEAAMVLAALFAFAVLGRHVQEPEYRAKGGLRKLTADSFLPIAGPLVILSAAGGLSGVLRTSGAAQAAVSFAIGAHMPPLVLAWALAATVRVAMGSATVAMAVAAGILAPMAATMGVRPEMLVLATGAGSLLLSHVNDSGFWLIGSLFRIDVKTTLTTWSAVETVLSIGGLGMTLLLASLLH